MSNTEMHPISKGDALWDQGKQADAVAAYAEAFGLDPKVNGAAFKRLLTWTLSNLVRERQDSGKRKEAADIADMAAELLPDQPSFLIESFFGRWLDMDHNRAGDVLMRILRDHPSAMPSFNHRLHQLYTSESKSTGPIDRFDFEVQDLLRWYPGVKNLATIKSRIEQPYEYHLPVVLVMGMHRSGTSLLTAMLQSLGGWLGPKNRLAAARRDNPLGFYEQIDFVAINDDLLASAQAGWDAPPESNPFTLAGQINPDAVGATQRANCLMRGLLRTAPANANGVVVKDPRVSLVAEYWFNIIHSVRPVIIIRSPDEVARSLNARGDNSIQGGYRLWLQYQERLLKLKFPVPPILVRQSELVADPAKVLTDLASQLNWHVTEAQMNEAVSLYRKEFVHQRPLQDQKSTPNPVAQRLYKELMLNGWPKASPK